MGLVLISVTIDGKDLIASLGVIGANLADLTDPLTELLELGLEDARGTIDSQGTLYGDDWAPMSPWTELVSEVLYGEPRDPSALLMASGGLYGSLSRGGSGNIFEVEALRGEAGTEQTGRGGFPLGPAQQDGTSRTFHVLQGEGFSETGIPGRTILAWRERDDYAEVFARHVVKGA